jgi:DNA repair ATPase RecN
MRRIQTVIATLGVTLGLITSGAACGGKKEAPPAPVACPPGNVVKDGACFVAVTPEAITAVATLGSRLDDLAKVLDQVDTISAPIVILNGLRQLDQWQKLKASVDQLAAVDTVADALDTAVQTLRKFKGSLGEASARLGNLKGELDRLMTDTGTTRKLEEVRAQISTQLRATVEPFATQVQDATQNALLPLTTQLSRVTNLVIMGCTAADLSGGSDKVKDLCTQAEDGFTKARTYVEQLKVKPARLFTEVTAQLESQLGPLVDVETKKLVANAQAKVNEALRNPPAARGSGSAH